MKNVKVLGVFILFLLLVPSSVCAQTIQDINAKIKSIEAEKAENKEKSEKTQQQIDEANAKINEITREIVQTRKNQEETRKEIKELETKMKQKEEEIKDLVAFYQVSESDNFYLKFIFGADSFEDFIYRFSVAEQLTDANDKLVDEMNGLVKENKEKVKELEAQEKKLDGLNDEIKKQVAKLGSQKRKYSENALSADEEIAALKKQIKYYRSKGCSDNENVDICSRPKVSSYGSASSSSVNLRPSSSGFILPLSYGYVTSYYGGRIHPIFGVASHHDGIDIAADSGTTIMASNRGEVVWADWLWGFGYAVMVYHESCGCTTLYGHMSSISVSQGAGVVRGQKIGEVGSTGNSTGPHLHFQVMSGKGYNSSGIYDPEQLVYIPISW